MIHMYHDHGSYGRPWTNKKDDYVSVRIVAQYKVLYVVASHQQSRRKAPPVPSTCTCYLRCGSLFYSWTKSKYRTLQQNNYHKTASQQNNNHESYVLSSPWWGSDLTPPPEARQAAKAKSFFRDQNHPHSIKGGNIPLSFSCFHFHLRSW